MGGFGGKHTPFARFVARRMLRCASQSHVNQWPLSAKRIVCLQIENSVLSREQFSYSTSKVKFVCFVMIYSLGLLLNVLLFSSNVNTLMKTLYFHRHQLLLKYYIAFFRGCLELNQAMY